VQKGCTTSFFGPIGASLSQVSAASTPSNLSDSDAQACESTRSSSGIACVPPAGKHTQKHSREFLLTHCQPRVKNTFIHVETNRFDKDNSSSRSCPPDMTSSKVSDPEEFNIGDNCNDLSSERASEQYSLRSDDICIWPQHTKRCEHGTQTPEQSTKSYVDIDVQTSCFNEEVQRLASLTGPWSPVKSLNAGVIIELKEPVLSGDKVPIQLRKGLRGSVSRIDGDGDAEIEFPEMQLSGFREKIILFQSDFKSLRRHSKTHI